MAWCRNCLLPGNVPGANIDVSGLCSFCRSDQKKKYCQKREEKINKYKEELERLLTKRNKKGQYDVLVPVSGGKDSLYLLYILKKKYNLRILAMTVDIDIPPIAWDNIKRATNILEIPHITYTIPENFLKKLFKYLLQNQEERGAIYTVSYVYAPIFEGQAIITAIEKNIPLILAGYSPGQPDPDRMFFEFSQDLIQNKDWTPPALKKAGIFSEDELNFFYNPLKLPKNINYPRYIAPFHVWDYNQQKIIDELYKYGIIKSKKYGNPILTNYPINWLLMYSDIKHFGYNPYHPEFSALIREGKASKRYWQIMAPIVNFMIKNKVLLGKNVKKKLKWLEITEKDLKITLPKGAYDPI